MQRLIGTTIGKTVGAAARLRGGGQALPGLVVEKVLPGYITAMLSHLPGGVVLVTGTNGKTTTTKIIVDLLTSGGKRVLTNSTGSNMTRGIASGLAKQATVFGKLHFDIAVFEVDEASARRLIAKVKPTWVVALNVSRDQLDRFGEVDTVADLIGDVMSSAITGVVANGNDPYLADLSGKVKVPVDYFGSAAALGKYFPSDQDLVSVGSKSKSLSTNKLAVELAGFDGQTAKYKIGGKIHPAKLKLNGQHNFLNAAAALTIARRLMPERTDGQLVADLQSISTAFGRGEVYDLSDGKVELVLVKNPAGFRQALASYADQNAKFMLAINDNIADGRDVSWLWDVDFTPLAGKQIAVTSGQRAADIALRLKYDGILTNKIEPNLRKGLSELRGQKGSKIIFATYTAMTKLYQDLKGAK